MNHSNSKKLWGFLVATAVLVGVAAECAAAVTVIMPVDQIKAGMKGKGRSVFEGDRIEEFDVEIIGVLKNYQPKRDLIMARLRGRNLETTGVIEGMSGSPVYIDGKLIGAVAYSYPFSKEPIAGITPIEEMLAIKNADAGRPSSTPPALASGVMMTPDDLLSRCRSALTLKSPGATAADSFAPLNIPLVFGGFSAEAFDKAKPFFSGSGFQPVRSGSSGKSEPGPEDKTSFSPGDAVGVQLISGDLDLTAVGTVTHVDGDDILAFGHPFYSLGAVEYAMTKADVLTVVPSLQSSFKLASSGAIVGKVIQDRTAGAFGVLGRMPKMIPVNLKLEGGPGVKKEYNFRIVNDKVMSAALINMALSSIVTAEERSSGNLTLDFDGNIFLDNGQSIHLEDFYSGNYGTPTTSFSTLVASVVYYLVNNEFKDVGIYRIDLNVRAAEEAKFCSLEKVILDKYEAKPGEVIQIKVLSRTYKEEIHIEDAAIQAPNLPAGTEFYLVVGDASVMQQVELSQYKAQDFVPRDLDQLIRVLGNLRKNNRIYFKIMADKPGLFLKGEEMPNLPPTLKSMFSSPRVSVSSPMELLRSTLNEYQSPVPFVFRGGAVIPIRIRK